MPPFVGPMHRRVLDAVAGEGAVLARVEPDRDRDHDRALRDSAGARRRPGSRPRTEAPARTARAPGRRAAYPTRADARQATVSVTRLSVVAPVSARRSRLDRRDAHADRARSRRVGPDGQRRRGARRRVGKRDVVRAADARRLAVAAQERHVRGRVAEDVDARATARAASNRRDRGRSRSTRRGTDARPRATSRP